MVSEPTGRKRGRPPKKKDAAPSPKRDPWRPKKSLAQDPHRWDLALVERHVRVGKMRGYSELQIHELLAASAAGAVVRTPENIALFESGQPFRVWMPPHKKFKLAREDTPTQRSRRGWQWRQENVFRPPADDARRKLLRFRKEDAGRLRAMVTVWELCIRGNLEEAMRLARQIGEADAFEAKLRKRRLVGSAPEFPATLIPT
jgi:hypothetical protein